jgi:spermidine synthase
VRIVVADVAVALAEAHPASYDLILLDVDNGPGYLVHEGNAALYEEPLLTTAREALRPGGVLAVWSADQSPALAAVLESVFGNVEVQPLDVALQGRDEHYWLYAARRA